MSDTLRPTIHEHQVLYASSIKPQKETSHQNIGLIQSIDSVINDIHSYNTVQSATVNEIDTYIRTNQGHLDNAKKTEIDKNLKLLKEESKALEVIEVADALATIDSPWGALTQTIADSNRLKRVLPDIKAREQYVDKLLFPLGAELFRDIRLMTSDPLTRQLMFQSVADEIISAPERILATQEFLPNPKDKGTIKNTMRRVSILLLGGGLRGNESNTQIDAMYKKTIHKAALRSRLSAEQPLFDITATEHTLKETKHEYDRTVVPFAKEESARSLRVVSNELDEMRRIRHVIDRELPSVQDEPSLMRALDSIQQKRFAGTREEVAPYKLEPWVPERVRSSARTELELLSQPKEDLYAKALKKLGEAERLVRSGNKTWTETKYKDHMKWLADPKAQAQRMQRIINTVDLIMTVTTLVSGVTGNIQRQIEGSHPNGMTIRDYIDFVESQNPWEVAADLATPKIPKNRIAAAR